MNYRMITKILAALICLAPIGCASTGGSQDGLWTMWPHSEQISASLQTSIDDMSKGDLQSAENRLAPELRASSPAAASLYAEIASLKGDIPTAIDRYIDVIKHDPSSAFVPLAVSRMLKLSEQTAAPLDFDKLSSLQVEDSYALSRLVVLQSRAMRGTQSRTQNLLKLALPLSKFQWIGPFSPYIYTGFDESQVFDNDEFLANTYEFDGIKLNSFNYELENQTVMAASKDGVYAGETYIQMDKKQDVLLIVRSNQLYEVFIDGTSVLRRDAKDFGTNNILAVPIEFTEGTHAVRVKLGLNSGGGGKSPIALWLAPIQSSKDNASSQDVLSGMEEISERSSAQAGKIKAGHIVDIAHMVGKLDSVPTDELRTWFGASLAIADGQASIAEQLLLSRLSKNPEDRIAQYWMAWRYKIDADMDTSLRNEKSMQYLRDLSNTAPQMSVVSNILIAEMINAKQTKEVTNYWNEHRRNMAQNADSYLIQSSLAKSLNWQSLANEYVKKAFEQRRDSCAIASLLLAANNEQHHYTAYDALSPEIQRCPAVIRTYAKNEADDNAQSPTRWLDALKKLSSEFPNDSRLKLETLSLYGLDEYKSGNVTKKMHDRLSLTELGAYPDIDIEQALVIIDILRSVGKTDDAGSILTKLTEMYPAEESLQNMDWQIHHKRPLEELRIDGMKVIKDYMARKSSTNEAEEGTSLVVLDYAATRFYPNGAKIGLTHIISKVLSKEGKNAVGEVYLPSNTSVLKVRTIKADTLESIEPESIDFKSSITAPNLAVGDFVETEYLTYEPPMSNFTARAVSDAFFYGSAQTPIERSEYVFEYPKDWNIGIVESGPENQIIRNCETQGEYIHCSAYREKIPFFISEPGAPNEFDLLPNIQIYHQWGWNEIKHALRESIVRQTRITPYVERYYKKIEMSSSESVWERARAIYDFVQGSIHESESTHSTDADSATRTISRGVGSRVVTLKALYDLAGIPSYFALVRSVGAPKNSAQLPAHYESSYATYLVVDTERGPAYADPSEDFMMFDYLPTNFHGQQVIPIDMTRDEFISRNDNPEDIRPTIEIEYQISEDGTASAKSVEIMRGTRDITMRGFLTSLKGDETRIKLIIENSLARNYGRISLTRFEQENLDNNQKPLKLYYDFDIASFASANNGNLDINSSIYAYKLVDMFAKLPPEVRKYPVIIANDTLSQRKLTFHAPKGYVWNKDTLHDVVIETKYGKFSRQMHIDGEHLELIESIQVMPQRVELSEYAAFRKFCLDVDEAQRTVIGAHVRG